MLEPRDAELRPIATDTATVRGAIDAIWRIESGRLIAGLARITGDLSQAEDMAHESLGGRARTLAGDLVSPLTRAAG